MLLVRSSLWNSEERARAQPEDADGIDFPGEFRFVRCVCLRAVLENAPMGLGF